MATATGKSDRVLGLRPYKALSVSSMNRILAALERENGPLMYHVFRRTMRLEWRFGMFDGGKKQCLYLQKVDKETGKDVGRPIKSTAKGPGRFTMIFVGPLSGNAAFDPASAGRFAEANKVNGYKVSMPMMIPEDEGFDRNVYREMEIAFNEWSKLTNEDLVEFLATARHDDGNLVGKIVYPAKWKEVVDEQRGEGITDNAEHEIAFAKMLRKAHKSSSDVSLRRFKPFASLKTEFLVPDWNAKNDGSNLNVLSPNCEAELKLWEEKYAGNVEQLGHIAAIRHLLMLSTDPKASKLENPRRIHMPTFIADGLPVRAQEVVDVPVAGAPVAISVMVCPAKITQLGETLQVTNNMVPTGLTFFAQGKKGGGSGIMTVSGAGLISDDEEDDDDDAALVHAADAVETAGDAGVPAEQSTPPSYKESVEAAEPVPDTPASPNEETSEVPESPEAAAGPYCAITSEMVTGTNTEGGLDVVEEEEEEEEDAVGSSPSGKRANGDDPVTETKEERKRRKRELKRQRLSSTYTKSS